MNLSRPLLLVALAAANAAALTPSQLRTEYLADPEAVDTQRPRLTWLLESPERGARQSAYRILAASSPELLARDRGDLWDTGKRASRETVNIPYEGKPPGAGRTCWWKVQVWDAAGKASGWSANAKWAAGLAPGDWTAQWISYRDRSDLHRSRKELYLPPSRYYRKAFAAAKPVRRAMLYASALGIFDAYINGRRVSDAMFSPGWSDYRRRAYYRAWDVTALVAAGANAIGAEVADGWYSGYVGYGLLVGYGPYKSGRAMYGKTPALLAQLRIEFADGATQTVATDASWKVSEAARREADIIMGETYDARREQPGWSSAPFNDGAWEPAIAAREFGSLKAVFSDRGGDREMEFGFTEPATLQAYPGPPVRPIQELRPKRMLEPAPGTWVFDLGQNFSGVARIRAKGPAGTAVKIRFAEMIYPGGRLMTENLRKARATDTFILRGDAAGESFTPRFTYHGFQYVELTGYPGKPTLDDVTGVVIHSDTPLTSRFESSDPMVNRLFENVVWTQRSNFVELPTDCPQRDERLGWTGDAQVYARAAAYHADTAAFYTKWLDDLTEAQRPNGAYPDYAPYPMQHGEGGYAYGTGWMDAGVIVPWTVWRAYGDTDVIRRHWTGMARFIDFRMAQSPELRGSNKFNHWGDWLAIGSSTPVEYIDAVYFAYSTTLMAQMAEAIDKPAEAKRYGDLAARIRERFRQDYLKEDGTLKVDTQTAYALALAHEMAPGARQALAERLAKMIAENGHRMTTGFLGTYPLLPVLSESGHHDLAVRLFQSREFPSWGYEVENGATTIWERWNSYTKDKGFFAPAMNSYSHYAFGAVSEWMFYRLGGIRAAAPGYRRIAIAPEPPAPGSNPDQRPIDWVNASYRSIRGTISVRWKQHGNAFTLEATIPPNTDATVTLPARDAASVTEGGKAVKVESFTNGKASFKVESGTYSFRSETSVAATYSNPVGEKPIVIGDPFVFQHGGKYYLFGTNAPDGFRYSVSTDMVHWTAGGYAWQRTADSWSEPPYWAPEVKQYGGKFYMTYSGKVRGSKPARLLTALAVSDRPEGPYKDLHAPWFDPGYSVIDANIFVDTGGTPYLYFSRNGFQDGYSFGITYGVELTRDLARLVGDPVKLIEASQPWERINWADNRCNEGPTVLKHNGKYLMTYSANHTGRPGYGVGVAVADQPLGPWVKDPKNPILASRLDIGVSSPGHNSITHSPDGKEMFIVYHTHADPAKPSGDRVMNIDRLVFEGDGLRVLGPTRSPQAMPSGAK